MEPLVLHVDGFWISPYVLTAFVALTEKGLPFTTREVRLHERAQAAPDFQARSTTGRVPVLEHGAFRLSESSAIAEYLEDAFPPPAHPSLLPAAPRERARARQIMAWIRSDLMPIRDERSTHTVFYARARAPLSAAGEAAAARLIAAASAFVPDGETTLFGAFSIADADLAMMLQRLIVNGHAMPAKLVAFAEAAWRRPSVQAFVAHARPPYIEY